EKNQWFRQELRELYTAAEAWEQLGQLIARESELEEDVTKKVDLLREAAKIHGEKRNDRAAEAELLSQASDLRPDDRELLLQLCDSYSASGRAKQAIEALQRVVDSYAG